MLFRYTFLLFIFSLYGIAVSAGTLEDIRIKTGWEPAVHSKRKDAYVPLLEPAELVASLDKYHRDRVKMQVLFSRITTTGLNKWIGRRYNRHMWSSKRYIAFRVKDLQKQVHSSNIYLFLDKDRPDRELLLSLTPDTRITVIGVVKDIAQGKAWIEVDSIILGWERIEG